MPCSSEGGYQPTFGGSYRLHFNFNSEGPEDSSTKEFLTVWKIALDGLVVAVIAIGPKIRGFKPRRGRSNFKGYKNP
jgi:hypothetical protein